MKTRGMTRNPEYLDKTRIGKNVQAKNQEAWNSTRRTAARVTELKSRNSENQGDIYPMPTTIIIINWGP